MAALVSFSEPGSDLAADAEISASPGMSTARSLADDVLASDDLQQCAGAFGPVVALARHCDSESVGRLRRPMISANALALARPPVDARFCKRGPLSVWTSWESAPSPTAGACSAWRRNSAAHRSALVLSCLSRR
jgi:hypothetical protein